MSKEQLKADIMKFFEGLSTPEKYRVKSLKDNNKELIWALIKSKRNDYKTFFILCTNNEISDDEILDYDIMYSKCNTIFTWDYTDELAEGLEQDVYRFNFADFNFSIPEDQYSLTKQFRLKLVDLPKFKASFKEARWSNLFTALENDSYRYYGIANHIDDDIQMNIKSVMGVYTYQVYDIAHDSDEEFDMQYLEWNTEPLCVITKYADKSHHDIKFYSKEIERRFINALINLRTWDDDELYIISETDEESDNYYGSTIVYNNSLYFNIKSPSWCMGYVKIPNPHRCVMTSFNDVQMIPVSIVGYRKIDASYSSPVLVKINQDGVELEVKPSEIFFLGGEYAPVL